MKKTLIVYAVIIVAMILADFAYRLNKNTSNDNVNLTEAITTPADFIALGKNLVLMTEKEADRYMKKRGAEIRKLIDGSTFYVFGDNSTITRTYISGIVPTVKFNVECTEDELRNALIKSGWVKNNRYFTYNNQVTIVYDVFYGNMLGLMFSKYIFE